MHHTYDYPHIPWHIICMNIYHAQKHIYTHTPHAQSSNISREKENKCVFLCIWIVYKVPCTYIDMNSRFILSGCAVSDFLHFTGQPAVQLHYTCPVQFVSKRFPKLWNILSAAWPAHHSASARGASTHIERMAQKEFSVYIYMYIYFMLGAHTSGPIHSCHCAGVGFKDKWLHVNQIWHAAQKQPPLVPWHSQREKTTSSPGKRCPTGIKAQQFVT